MRRRWLWGLKALPAAGLGFHLLLQGGGSEVLYAVINTQQRPDPPRSVSRSWVAAPGLAAASRYWGAGKLGAGLGTGRWKKGEG